CTLPNKQWTAEVHSCILQDGGLSKQTRAQSGAHRMQTKRQAGWMDEFKVFYSFVFDGIYMCFHGKRGLRIQSASPAQYVGDNYPFCTVPELLISIFLQHFQQMVFKVCTTMDWYPVLAFPQTVAGIGSSNSTTPKGIKWVFKMEGGN
uniref:Uncharacterized protein n=1 Tax=Oryzias latipes TaxID=8090 RepID=A0A3B3ILM3_ORYLA